MGLFDRFRRATLAAPPRALTADARRIDLTQSIATASSKPGSAHPWQVEAWQRFDEVGELRAVCQWFANSLSRARLIASELDPLTGHPTGKSSDAAATQMVSDIAGGPAGQATMLSRLATFLTVPGEAWVAIIDRDDDPAAAEEWHVIADSEIATVGQDVEITLPDSSTYQINPDTDSLFRVWRSHPRSAAEADSPVRAALPILREIRRTEQAIDAAGKSRIAGNGILALPTEISMPTGLVPGGDDDAPGLPADAGGEAPIDTGVGMRQVDAGELMSALQEAMTTSIRDQASAAAMVPIVIQAAGEHIDKIRHITLDSTVTETNLHTRESAIRRLALSLDIPPEVLLGHGDSNHWSAWASRDEAISQHLAPMMTLICDALTSSVLHPLLAAQGHPDPERVVVWFDLSDLSRRPDRREDAAAAFDRGVISPQAYRQELGYGDDDAPDRNSDEAMRELAIQLVSQAPSLLPSLAHIIGFDVAPTQIDTGPGAPSAAPSAPADPPGPPIPDTDRDAQR